jgi:4-amino-4-deoxy-L-arabinose transferase-like glycosyltransferase
MSVQPLAPRLGVRPARVARLGALVSTAPLVTVAALAAALRFEGLGSMPLNPYYDAAVRSMGSSWHAFLFGAFDPNASVAVDKPPLDLWLQVASTKLFGFGAFALLLPEALASTAAVVLLYDLVRRGFGRAAGLAAAAALAVLPLEVIVARSDTMDGVMMALLVLAAWLVVRAVETERALYLCAAGVAVGLAFETKLFEALLPLPALALLFLVGSRAAGRRRLGQLALAAMAMVCVGLAWPLVFAVLSRNGQPYPLGSTNGSIWNTIFVYNGVGRLTSGSTRTAADLMSPPGPLRLVSGGPLQFDRLVGRTLVAALAFAVVAVVVSIARWHAAGTLPRALALAIGAWLLLGVMVLSAIHHAPARYLEVLTPAAAAVLGIGVTVATQASVRAIAAVGLVLATTLSLIYAGLPPAGLVAGGIAAGLLVFRWLVARRAVGLRFQRPLGELVTAMVVVAVLAAPAARSLAFVRARTDGGGALGRMPASEVHALSRYLGRHRSHSRYEFASASAALAAAVIAADGRPVLVLAGTPYHQLVSPSGLARAVRAGQVRYVLLSATGRPQPLHRFAPRTPRERLPAWVIRHGTDVTRQAGLKGYGVLYRV